MIDELFLKTRIAHIEEVITEEGYLAGNLALWELYGELKRKLLEPVRIPKVLMTDPDKEEFDKITKLTGYDPIPPIISDPSKLSNFDLDRIKKLLQEGDKPMLISQKLGIPVQRLYGPIQTIKNNLKKEIK